MSSPRTRRSGRYVAPIARRLAYCGTLTHSVPPQRALNTAIGGNTNSVYLIVGDIGTRSGSGLDFINGQTFLERFYSVFDTANNRVGIANTPFTRANTN